MHTQPTADTGIVDYDSEPILNPHDHEYHTLLARILDHGIKKNDRTGTGTISVFGHQMRFDLSKGFPLLTTKKVHLKSVIYELLWFLRGDTNIKYLKEHGVTIWDEWADEHGELGPVYGSQWRKWPKLIHVPAHAEGAGWIPDFYKIEYIDQILEVIRQIKFTPDSRRIIVSAWNVADIPRMKLPPCHCLFQFFVADDRLSCQLYQRSSDVFLGVPFNIASYSLLTLMMAQVCTLEPGEFIWTSGDTHIYLNHLEQVDLQLSRKSRKPPTMRINPDVKDIFGFTYEDFTLEEYHPHPIIKAPVSV